MRYSVITINYNNKDGLIRTIDSVLCLSNKDFEYIIIATTGANAHNLLHICAKCFT